MNDNKKEPNKDNPKKIIHPHPGLEALDKIKAKMEEEIINNKVIIGNNGGSGVTQIGDGGVVSTGEPNEGASYSNLISTDFVDENTQEKMVAFKIRSSKIEMLINSTSKDNLQAGFTNKTIHEDDFFLLGAQFDFKKENSMVKEASEASLIASEVRDNAIALLKKINDPNYNGDPVPIAESKDVPSAIQDISQGYYASHENADDAQTQASIAVEKYYLATLLFNEQEYIEAQDVLSLTITAAENAIAAAEKTKLIDHIEVFQMYLVKFQGDGQTEELYNIVKYPFDDPLFSIGKVNVTSLDQGGVNDATQFELEYPSYVDRVENVHYVSEFKEDQNSEIDHYGLNELSLAEPKLRLYENLEFYSHKIGFVFFSIDQLKPLINNFNNVIISGCQLNLGKKLGHEIVLGSKESRKYDLSYFSLKLEALDVKDGVVVDPDGDDLNELPGYAVGHPCPPHWHTFAQIYGAALKVSGENIPYGSNLYLSLRQSFKTYAKKYVVYNTSTIPFAN